MGGVVFTARLSPHVRVPAQAWIICQLNLFDVLSPLSRGFFSGLFCLRKIEHVSKVVFKIFKVEVVSVPQLVRHLCLTKFIETLKKCFIYSLFQSCIYLSQGTRFADTLDSSIRKLLHQTPHRRMSMSGTVSSTDGIKRSSSFVLSTSLTESVGGTGRADDSISVDWIQVEDTITAMETLMYYCEKGKRCCSRIINCYKISQVKYIFLL